MLNSFVAMIAEYTVYRYVEPLRVISKFSWRPQRWMKKRSERRKHCARAGCCSKVRTPPARLLQTHKHTDRTDNNTLRR